MEGDNIIGMFDVTGGGAISLGAGRPVRTVGRAGRERAPDRGRADGASGAIARSGEAPRHRLPRPRHDAELAARRHAGDAQGPLQDHDRLYAEGRHARPRHDVPHLHGAGEPRLLLAKPTWSRSCACRWRCSRWRPRCSPIRRSPKASRTASSRSARRSGPTPTPTAPACCPGPSRTAWASRLTSITRSTCRCISSSAATNISTSPASRSAISSPASSKELPGERPTISDWANHLSTIFPEVRLKRYLEMRGADGGPWRRLPSLTAYWVGLLVRRGRARRLLGHGQAAGAPSSARSCATTCPSSASAPRSATATC